MAANPAIPLRAFLESRRVTSPQWNITGMGSHVGKYYVADEDYGDFLQVYHDHVFTQRQPAHLLERHSPVAAPILIDLDLHYAVSDPPFERTYTSENIQHFVNEYAKIFHRFIAYENPIRFYVHTIPTPIHDATHGRFKDGIHIICPDINMHYDDMFALRKYVLDNTTAITGAFHGISNTPNDCFDDSVIQRNNWFLYGSTKSLDRKPYVVSTCYILEPDGAFYEEPASETTAEYVVTFSIRAAEASTYTIRSDVAEEWNTWKSICDKKPKAKTTETAIVKATGPADDTDSVVSHLSEHISKIIHQPGLTWEVAEEGDGYKLTHNSKRCLVATDVEHSSLGHSCVFVTAAVANLVCFSHKTKRLPKPVATALWKMLAGETASTSHDAITERYSLVKSQFERGVFRILDPPGYMVQVCDKWIHYTRAQLIDMNSGVFVDEEKKIRFIDQWLRDDSIRTYARADYFVDAAECPSMVFNTFKGFVGAQIASQLTDDVDISPILNHVSILCNHQTAAVEYVLDWFASMIQRPSFINGVAIVFMGPRGCGKDTFLSWFSNDIIGTGNYFRTARPQTDLFGSFNTSRKNVVFYHLDEGNSASMTKENVEQFKNYITDTHAAIQTKNQNTTAGESLVRNYNHFAISTNNSVPFHIDFNERRFFAVRASAEVACNWSYFAALRATMADPAVVATFYRFLMGRTVGTRNWCDMPPSDALSTWKTECMPALHSFIDWFKANNTIPCTIRAADFYGKYMDWCAEAGEDQLSVRSWGLEMRNIGSVSKIRSSGGNIYSIG